MFATLVGPSRRRRAGHARLLALAAALALPVAPVAAQDAPLRIAVLDIDFVAVQSPAGQQLTSEIQALRQQYAEELATRQAEVNDIQAQVAAVGEEDIEQQRVLQRRYQDALTAFQRYQQDVQAQAQRRQNEGLARVREEIGPVIEGIMREEGYDLILNTANPAVVMSSDRVDITQAVLERLQAGGGGG